MTSEHQRNSALPTPRMRALLRPFERFIHNQSASGVVLLVCTAVALALANSPAAAAYHEFWHTHISIHVGTWSLDHSLAHWVNDGLMAIFFFAIGLEIKREVVSGELRDLRKAALPIMAALGGMIVPASIYFALQQGTPGARGWGIPMATDIAFVVGILALLGKRVPLGLKILLLALAIADDIGAVLVIAFFYTAQISLFSLGIAGAGLVATVILNLLGVRNLACYVVVGIVVWLACLLSGVHATIAGVLLGLLTPARSWVSPDVLEVVVASAHQRISQSNDWIESADQQGVLAELSTAAIEASSPLDRLERNLHPWVAFGIMPLFALANAGVELRGDLLGHSVAISVALGLFIGKPLGVLLFSWLAVMVGLAKLPIGVNWLAMLGAGCLAGIGFTMSLFVASLALEGELLVAGKVGTLTGSLLSAVVGSTLLFFVLTPPEPLPVE